MIGEPSSIRTLASGRFEEGALAPDGSCTLIAKEALEIGTPVTESIWHRTVFSLRFGSSRQIEVTRGDTPLLRLELDPQDEAAMSVTAHLGEVAHVLTYRAVPDTQRWSLQQEERRRFDEEFRDVPGWPARWLRVGVEVLRGDTRLWIDGRYIAGGRDRNAEAPIKARLRSGGEISSVEVYPFRGGHSRYVPVDLRSYHNSSVLEGDLPPRFSPGDGLVIGQGSFSVHGIPFHIGKSEGHDNLDIGLTAYRGRLSYVHSDSMSPDPARALLRIPKGYYDRVHLICASDTSEQDLPAISVRMIKSGRGHAITHEFEVPRWDDVGKGSHPGLRRLPLARPAHSAQAQEDRSLWLLSANLNPGDFQEFLEDDDNFVEVDLTSKVWIDDESFPRPTERLSAVHVFAATFELAPAKMVVDWCGVPPVFERPEVPRLRIRLVGQRDVDQVLNLSIEIVDPYGGHMHRRRELKLHSSQCLEIIEELDQSVLGKHEVTVRLASQGRLLEHRSSFAILPADTRISTTDSPFGMWCFFEAHLGLPPEDAAPLLRKAGVRWTLPGFLLSRGEDENVERLGILKSHGIGLNCGHVCCIGNTCCANGGDPDEMIRKMKTMPKMAYWMVFWETSLSPRHRDAFPQELLGRPPIPLGDEERLALENCWRAGAEYSRRVREQFPDVKLVFGNGFPAFIGAMMREGYPKEHIDALGLDFDLFTAMPERQPGPLYAPFSSIFIAKALQDHYGYRGPPIVLTEAIYSPVASVWLTEREQADHYVRAHLLGLASGVTFFGMCSSLYDPGDGYFYSHYGPIGLLSRPPGLNPRESFCAYSNLTRMLDQGEFDSLIEVESTSVYALRFTREGGPVHALWTIRGKRPITIKFREGKVPSLTDPFGNVQELPFEGRAARLELASSPVYIEGVDGLDLELGEAAHGHPDAGGPRLASFPSLHEWRAEVETVNQLDELHTHFPLTAGPLDISIVESHSGRGPVLCVRKSNLAKAHPMEMVYMQLRRTGDPITVPESASALGTVVYGDSSWGRVLYDLEDSQGVKWFSLRADTYIDFDGWRSLVVPLPHAPKGRRVGRTGFSPWVTSEECAEPAYPMSVTGLVLEARSHVIYVGRLRPVPDPGYCVESLFLITD